MCNLNLELRKAFGFLCNFLILGGEGFCQYCNEKTKCGTFFQNDDGMRMRMFVREGGEGWQSSNNVQNVLMRCRV